MFGSLLFFSMHVNANQKTYTLNRLVKSYSNRVATIFTDQTSKNSAFDLYKHYFGGIYHFKGNEVSLGSAFIVEKDFAVTSYSQVSNFSQISLKITTLDRLVKANIVGLDRELNIAILRLKNPIKNLKHVTDGKSQNLHLGDRLTFMGNPFGKGKRGIVINKGIVTAKMNFAGIKNFSDLFQVNISVHPGILGGPIFDRRGRLVGLASFKSFKEASGSFFVPIHVFRGVYKNLKVHGKRRTSWIGVKVESVNSSNSSNAVNGVLVKNIIDKSPSFLAGLRIGDIIKRIDEQEVSNVIDMRNIIRSKNPGSRSVFYIFRSSVEYKKIVIQYDNLPNHTQLPDLSNVL